MPPHIGSHNKMYLSGKILHAVDNRAGHSDSFVTLPDAIVLGIFRRTGVRFIRHNGKTTTHLSEGLVNAGFGN
jgi:hypothetical protein